MKKLLILVALVTISTTRAGWFDHNDDQHREQIHQLNIQLHQQQESKANWQIAAFILGLGCILTLIAGAAIGSKGRRAVHEPRE